MLYVNPVSDFRYNNAEPDAVKAKKEKTVLQEFEHLLLYNMLQEMHKTTSWGKSSTGNQEKQMYDDMFNDTLGGVMAKSGQLGIAKQIEDQLNASRIRQKVTTANNTTNGAGITTGVIQ